MSGGTTRHPSSATAFGWDENNENKLLQRGITAAEVEALWGNSPSYRRNKRSGTAQWMMVGRHPTSGSPAQDRHSLAG